MRLNSLKPAEGSKSTAKRVGRGIGSGLGKTCGRGHKGQKSRAGGYHKVGFEGGQMPLQRRLPKRGFTNIFRKKIAVINVRDLSKFESGSLVDKTALVNAGLVKGQQDGIKLLGHGDIKIALTVKISQVSKAAREKIEAAGGTVEVV